MTSNTKQLDDLFHDTLKDMYFAEKKILSTLPKMAKVAVSPKLKMAFESHNAETEGHVKRLEEVFGLIDAKPQAKTCDAMMGLVKEGEAIIEEYKGSPALDAALLVVAQAVEHYEMARYGALKSWADELGMHDAAAILETTLQEEKKTDAALSALAISVINIEAEAA